ncbi:GGDEF domain-containing protein [Aliagarivorans taiwanensis]|uniref:GGDEF domain-containing protein n=1 Tax=Aliagarivorans taiwanensis TaxID=561966 RepID=UPI0003FB703A|nr:GGDEF domain-containing protein [Aliagarivorans taiwanensis]
MSDVLQFDRDFTATSRKIGNFTENNELSASQKLAFVESLLQDLTLEGLLQTFAAQVYKHVTFSSLRLSAGEVYLEQQIFSGQRYYRSIALNEGRQALARITYTRDTPFAHNEIDMLKQLSQLAQSTIKNGLQLYRLQQRVRSDYLTGIGNRAHFDEALNTAVEQQQRQSRESDQGLTLMLIDLNRFKQINDEQGHPVGDQVLIHFANTLKSITRGGDQAFRIGGDEFAMLLTPCSSDSAELIKLRLDQALLENPVLSRYKVSAAVGACRWSEGNSIDELINQADQSLYQDKHQSI